ncbi:prepilin-type N-terminal cleavage/methylation domain-containing protein [Planococcus salinus]|uniref:Prepilin-type N-terminal cleavage/methylation domain-containing protein n=1 Tax=Planococcus salinus TaxID=1848460 RepID=A0A3M8PCE5_9BACL|nr:prepilin-type N-terminal cleavage/methylation domain-containing protein [Planococcus salinus]
MESEKGITLVELLAALVISSIIVVLAMNIFSTGQNQYNSQNIKVEQLNDVRYALKVITKEIRQADKVEIEDPHLKLGTDSSVIFTFEDGEILHNGVPLLLGIQEFPFEKDEKDNRILIIKVKSSEQKGKMQQLQTEIYIREGVIFE